MQRLTDTKGWDALALEGAHASLRAQRIVVLKFEYSGKGFWEAGRADGRTLGATQEWLRALGYYCFLELPGHLRPISGACWRAEYEYHRWSDVVCSCRPEVLDAFRGLLKPP